jgi:hypothetical protein
MMAELIINGTIIGLTIIGGLYALGLIIIYIIWPRDTDE